jgi:hypothetical protein
VANPMRNITVAILICTCTVVLLLDAIVAVGLSFTGPGHYSLELAVLLLLACCIDLPGSIIGIWRPRLAALIIGCGICGTLLYAVLYFLHIHQLPTLRIVWQAAGFLGPKMILVLLMYIRPREEAKHHEFA